MATGFERGKQAAIKLLEGTAEDFEEIAARFDTPNRTPLEFRQQQLFLEKATLLRGQITQIQQLKE
jgi:hypothetical protein